MFRGFQFCLILLSTTLTSGCYSVANMMSGPSENYKYDKVFFEGNVALYRDDETQSVQAILEPSKPLAGKYRNYGKASDAIYILSTKPVPDPTWKKILKSIEQGSAQIFRGYSTEKWVLKERLIWFDEVDGFEPSPENLQGYLPLSGSYYRTASGKMIIFYTRKVLLVPVALVADIITLPIQLVAISN